MKEMIQRAIEQFDLQGYVIDHGGRQAQPGQWELMCPTCGKMKLVVHIERKAWHCWVCEQYGYADPETGRRRVMQGAGGLLDLIQILERWDRKKAVEFLLAETMLRPQNIVSLDVPDLQVVKQQVATELREAPTIPYPEAAQPCDGTLTYLRERGILLEDARAFGLFWCSAGRYANRLILPVYEHGRLVYYQGRAMWKPQPGEWFVKALNPPTQPGMATANEVVFNLDVARHYPRVALCEGPISAIKCGPSAVCTFGKKISPVQIAKIARAGVRAVDLMWDGPAPERKPCGRCHGSGCMTCYGTGVNEYYGAWPEMMKVAPTLAALFNVRMVFIPKGDPGDHTREQNDWMRAHARPAEASQIAML